jgi:hypothetical protein
MSNDKHLFKHFELLVMSLIKNDPTFKATPFLASTRDFDNSLLESSETLREKDFLDDSISELSRSSLEYWFKKSAKAPFRKINSF